MQKAVEESETRMKEHVSHENAKVTIKIDETNKRVDIAFLFLLALLAFIGVLIGLPIFRERKKEREQDEQLEAQKQQLAGQQQLIKAQQEQLAGQQQQLAAQQQQLAAVREELAALKQQQSDDESLTTAAKSGDN